MFVSVFMQSCMCMCSCVPVCLHMYVLPSQNNLSLLKSSSAKTLAVEEKKVLESFDFLSTDFNADEDISCMGSVRLKDTGWVVKSLHEHTPIQP